MPSANAKQTSSLSSTLGIGSDNDQALPGGHGRFIDDVAELGSHLPSTAMQVFGLMESNLSKVQLLQEAKLYQHVRANHVVISLHAVTQLDLEKRDIMISQLVGKALLIVLCSYFCCEMKHYIINRS